MTDLSGRHQARGVGDVKRRKLLRTDAREVSGVTAVIAADHDRQIEGSLREEELHRILSILRRTADRLERSVVIGQARVAVSVDHSRADHLADLQRFRHEHRRLIGQSHPLKVCDGIESRRARGAQDRLKPVDADTASNEVAEDVGFVTIQDHHVAPLRRQQRLGGGGPCLLVMDLAVNDGRKAIFSVAAHVLPHIEH